MSASKREKTGRDTLFSQSGNVVLCLHTTRKLLWMGLLRMLQAFLPTSLLFSTSSMSASLPAAAAATGATTHSCKEPGCTPRRCTSPQTQPCVYKFTRMGKDWKWRPARLMLLIFDAILACFDHVTAVEAEVRERLLMVRICATRGQQRVSLERLHPVNIFSLL